MPALPLVLEPQTADATDIDAIETPGHGIEPRRIDDHVEFVLALAGLMPFGVMRSMGVS